MLNKTVIFYTADVYLDLLPVGTALPTEVELSFPLSELNAARSFRFGVAQMADKPTDIDFQALGEVNVGDVPQGDDPVDLRIFVQITSDKVLSMEAIFSPSGEPDYMIGDALQFGRYFVD
ncbi:MAG: hypothetical protein OHK0046_35980 [Anaerolineae bacterium]